MPAPIDVPNWAITAAYAVVLAGSLVFSAMAIRYWRHYPGWGRAAICLKFVAAALFVAYRIQLRIRMQTGWLGPDSVLFLVTLTLWAIGIWAMILAVRAGAIMRRGNDLPGNVIPQRRAGDVFRRED